MKYRRSVSLLISFIIIIGFAIVATTSYFTYGNIINENILNITELSSTNIYSEINNEITKPIFVSLTMANDSFVKNWLNNEENENEEEIVKYLKGLKKKKG